jgi:transaldolase
MYIFLDSANEEQIRFWFRQGVIDGVTTNPTMLRRDGVQDGIDMVVKMAGFVAPATVHIEVSQVQGDALVNEARALAELAPNIVVKVPVITPDGHPLLDEITELVAAGLSVNCTACLSFGQLALAAKTGAQYASLLVGRVGDEGGDGAQVLADASIWLDKWNLPTKLVAASLRGPGDVRRSMLAGAHCVTAPPTVLARLVDHKYARHTVQQFIDDAAGLAQRRDT